MSLCMNRKNKINYWVLNNFGGKKFLKKNRLKLYVYFPKDKKEAEVSF